MNTFLKILGAVLLCWAFMLARETMLGSQAHRVYEAQTARDVEIQHQVDESALEMQAMLARCGITLPTSDAKFADCMAKDKQAQQAKTEAQERAEALQIAKNQAAAELARNTTVVAGGRLLTESDVNAILNH